MISKLNFFIGFICCHLLSFLHLVSIEEVEPIGPVNDVRAFFLAELYLCLKVVGLLIGVQVE